MVVSHQKKKTLYELVEQRDDVGIHKANIFTKKLSKI